MKKILRLLTVLSIAASSILYVPSASAIGTLYNGTSGDVACYSGFFTISNNVVTGNTSCAISAVIPSGVTSIGDFAFYEADSISSLTIPNTVTTIGNYSFSGLISLTSLTIPNSVTTIGSNAFALARSLTSLTIPNSVTTIGEFAFYDLRSITSLTISNSLTSIPSNAFSFARSLTALTIPNSVTTIGTSAFAQAFSLTSLTIPNSVTSIGFGAFVDAGSLTSLTIPDSVTTIGGFAFYSLYALTSLTISNNVTSIGSSAFRDAGITSLVIPNSVTSIGSNAFLNTWDLASYQYCGTSLSSSDLSSAGLNGKTKVCTTPVTAPTPTPTRVLAPATIDSLTFKDDGTGTGGKLTWTGKLIDSFLYEGPASAFPGAFTYGSYNSTWNGNLVNLNPDTEYTFKLSVISKDGVGASKSITVKTEKVGLVLRDLAYWFKWLATNTYFSGEATNIYTLLSKFDALRPGTSSTTLKIPTSRVSSASAKSNTPTICVMSDAVTIRSVSKGTCTISYTVVGKSKAPATLVKSFTFRKFAK